MTPRPAAAFLLFAGCGLGALQTAHTTPPGETEVALALGYVRNDMIDERGTAIGNYQPELMLRRGLSDRVDLGLSMFLGAGLLADVKVGLLAPGRFALAVQAGVGAGKDLLSSAAALHVPVRVLGSVDLLDGRLIPYLGLGYGAFWIFGYGEREPGKTYVDRAGYGDGVLMATAGLAWQLHSGTRFIVEYDLWQPVVDDPGDMYEFSRSHVFLAGFSF